MSHLYLKTFKEKSTFVMAGKILKIKIGYGIISHSFGTYSNTCITLGVHLNIITYNFKFFKKIEGRTNFLRRFVIFNFSCVKILNVDLKVNLSKTFFLYFY